MKNNLILTVYEHLLLNIIDNIKNLNREFNINTYNFQDNFNTFEEISDSSKDIIISILGNQSYLKFLLQEMITHIDFNREYLLSYLDMNNL